MNKKQKEILNIFKPLIVFVISVILLVGLYGIISIMMDITHGIEIFTIIFVIIFLLVMGFVTRKD